MTLRSTLLPGCLALLGAAAACAQEAAAPQAPKGLLTTVSAGLTVTDGNSDTMLVNGSVVTEGEQMGLGSVRVGAELNYGESTVRTETTADGVTTVTEAEEATVDNAKAFANVKKTLGARTYASVDGLAAYDDIAQVDYRAMVGPALGLYLLKGEATKLSFDAGLSCLWEDVAEVSDSYVALRLAGRLEHAFSATARAWQSAEYTPEVGHADNYLFSAELGVEAALNAHLNLRLVLQDKYDSRPGEGVERNDLSLVAGISLKL